MGSYLHIVILIDRLVMIVNTYIGNNKGLDSASLQLAIRIKAKNTDDVETSMG